MDTAALSLALLVAELGSFAAAAREVGADPSSTSRAIAQLEDRLGLRLFQRSTRRLTPTAEGAAYLARVAPLIDALDAARDAAYAGHAQATGTLRLTASVAYGTRRLVPRLAALRAAAPEMEVELILTDANLDLVAERIDLAIRLAPAPEGDLISARLHDTAYRVVAAPDWIARNGHPHRPQALADLDCLRAALPGHRDAWTFRRDGAETRVTVGGSVTITTPLALHAAARAGLGPALLADWLCDEALAEGTLVDLFPGHAVTATRFGTAAWLLYPSRSWLPARVRVAIDVLRAGR